jgi:hypothetical protein
MVEKQSTDWRKMSALTKLCFGVVERWKHRWLLVAGNDSFTRPGRGSASLISESAISRHHRSGPHLPHR